MDWWEARERKAAWGDAIKDAGLEVQDTHLVQGTWSSASGARAIEKLLKQYPEMDAVFAGNDQMALSVLQTAAERGIRVPDDLAVIGFDGIPESEFYSPHLSTIYQNQDELGRTAVQELARLVDQRLQDESQIEPSQISLKPEMIVRESTKLP